MDDDSLEQEYLLKSRGDTLPRKWAILLTIMTALVLLFFVTTIVIGVLFAHEIETDEKPKNVILMISDGFGPASEVFARNYFQFRQDGPIGLTLPLDEILIGSSRTRASDARVTDSAAGATAFSCGIKTYNGAIAVDDNQQPCTTVLEAAQKKGMKTALVVTSRITHATPASFASHVTFRDYENDIAVQEVEHKVDIMFGGGLRHFLPQGTAGSARTDNRNLLNEAKDLGYNVILDRQSFDEIQDTAESLPILGLFTLSDMSYEIDRNPLLEPSLPLMAQKALNILHDATRDQKEGFFIMIEGSRIDHAAHDNDAAAHYQEIMQYQETVRIVKDFINQNPDTVMISVSDHECGGLTLGLQNSGDVEPIYDWFPSYLNGVTSSSSFLSSYLKALSGTPEEIQQQVEEAVTRSLGITDATDEEIAKLVALTLSTNSTSQLELTYALAAIVNVRAHLGWTTHGHTAVDVNLYGYGVTSDQLRGNVENTEIGTFIVEALDLVLDETLDLKIHQRESGSKVAIVDEWHHLTNQKLL